MDLLVRRARQHVHHLDRPRARRGRHRTLFHDAGRNRLGQASRDPQQRVRLVLLVADAEPRGELREDHDVRPGFADRFDHRLDQLQRVVAVAAGDVVVLEEGRRRQDHVRIAGRVRAHLVEDDGEQILALEPLLDAVLIRRGDQRVVVVDEQHLHRRRRRAGQDLAEAVHVDERASSPPARGASARHRCRRRRCCSSCSRHRARRRH